MRRLLILLVAMAILAGEPAVAAPVPRLDLPPLNFGSMTGFLYQLGQQSGGAASLPVR